MPISRPKSSGVRCFERSARTDMALGKAASRNTASRWGAALACCQSSSVGAVSEAIDLIGQYQDAGVQLLINSDYRNDIETHELMAAEVMPHFVPGT